MILDTIIGAQQKYAYLPKPFLRAFAFLSDPTTAQLAEGKHAIDGDRLLAIVQQYQPKPLSEGRLEAHRRYWDVQFVAAGEEQMGWAPLAGLSVDQPHDDERDIAFYTGPCQLFRVPAGTFTIFGPHDAHMPSIAVGDQLSTRTTSSGEQLATLVRKIVVKVEWK